MLRRRQEFRLLAFDILLIFLMSLLYPTGPARAGAPAIPGLQGSGIGPSAPAAQDLPVLRNAVQGVSAIQKPVQNKLVVHQTQDKAILDWESFNIGREAWTHFDQQGNANWAALNRIYDQNPSLIFGRLTADGKVYLVNPNGVLFGPDSKVTAHSVVASSLEMEQERFLSGLLRFASSGDSAANGTVSNQGTIETDELGSVFLIGPNVENSGTIRTPLGQIGLAAGTDVELSPDTTPNTRRSALVVNVQAAPGLAANRKEGQLIADTGLVGMYGREVRQEGLAQAVTAIKRNGAIELMASEKIVTGPESVTACPVSDSAEKAHESFSYLPGAIKMDGLDPASPLAPSAPVKRIEHGGSLEAPSGSVTMRAEERVYLDQGSRIDVSGSWVDLPGETNRIEMQLNSVELRDDYGQKGKLLQGAKIVFHATAGSAIGDVSGALTSEEKTALERSTKGGTVEIQASSGDIVIRAGGSVDFSGGGLRYGASAGGTTKLLCDRRIYDIREAPQWVAYDAVLGEHEVRYTRYGISEIFKGLFCGGSSPVTDWVPSYVEGADAGSLKLLASRIVLDGDLLGSVVTGPFQTESDEPTNELGLLVARGRRVPRAGRVEIGDPQDSAFPQSIDRVVHEIVLAANVSSLPADFGPTDPVPASYGEGRGGPMATVLDASKFAAAGLDSLGLYANTAVKTSPDASLVLAPGGSLAMKARSIQHFGNIEVPAGSVRIETRDNVTSALVELGGVLNPRYVPVRERIDLAPGSRISTGGQRIDHSLVGEGAGQKILPGLPNGGEITIEEKNRAGEGLIVHRGAFLDVTGGYEVDADGKVRGGDAGVLSLQGSALLLAGELKGHSLPGKDGGRISLHAEDVSVVSKAPLLSSGFEVDSDLPEFLKGKLLLSESRLADTGFTHIKLKSLNDLTVREGVHFAPSDLCLAPPLFGAEAPGSNVAFNRGETPLQRPKGEELLVRVRPEFAGPSSVEFESGLAVRIDQEDNPLAKIRIDPGSTVQVAPKGEIGLSAPGVEMAGTLEALGGEVRVKASQQSVVLEGGGSILARGFNQPERGLQIQGLPPGVRTVPGGNVALEAPARDIVLEPGSLIDVSGSHPVSTFLQNQDGSVSTFSTASDPGSIAFEFLTDLKLEGVLEGRGRLEGIRGGNLSLRKVDLAEGLMLDSTQIETMVASGFDGLSFQSLSSIGFSGSMDVQIGRKLTLDAPQILGSGSDRIRLYAPWVQLSNTYWPWTGPVAEGEAQLTLSGNSMDILGSLSLSGFDKTRLVSKNDLTLAERHYVLPGGSLPVWGGTLDTKGDLTLQAARVYPTTLSNFTVKSAGKITIFPSRKATGPVYSAGGRLTLEADGIEHRGTLAAPMGEVVLHAVGEGGRVYLARGSLTTTAGQASVAYGALDEEYWTVTDKSTNLAKSVESPPAKDIEIRGAEVVMQDGAALDISGGGAIFGFQFLPSIEGSRNPLGKAGRFVILPGVSTLFPGDAVWLSGTKDLPAGSYSLLPEWFAFLPGALVIEDLGHVPALGTSMLSPEGYRTVMGYETVSGTDLRSPAPRTYSVRPAADVIQEGYFAFREMGAGDAGRVNLAGSTTVLNGSIVGSAVSGYQGGVLDLTGEELMIGTEAAPLPDAFEYDSPLPEDLKGKLTVASSSLADKGLEEIRIGDQTDTRAITLAAGSQLEAPTVTLQASEFIALEPGSSIRATGTDGRVALVSPHGSVNLHEGAQVQASDGVEIDTASIDLGGGVDLDARELSFSGEKVVILSDEYAADVPDGVIISEDLWNKFASVERLQLQGRSELLFLGDVDLQADGDLVLESPRLAGFDPKDESVVSLSSDRIHLLNSGPGFGDEALADEGLFSLNAQEILIGHGDLLLDGFGQVRLDSQSGVSFVGKGSLTLDGDLEISAPRVTARFDSVGGYHAADFQINAPERSIRLLGNGGTPGEEASIGGSLSFLASRIQIGTPDPSGLPVLLEIPSGRLSLTALGSSDEAIVLNKNATIRSSGSGAASGGVVALRADRGEIVVGEGSRIDVSSSEGGDAGFVSLSAPEGRISLAGELLGEAQEGKGGSFALDAAELGGFSELNQRLAEGGFDGEWSFRVREGDLEIGESDRIRAERVRLIADQGSVSLRGVVDASGEQAGSAEIWAGRDLVLSSGSRVLAKGLDAGAAGGEVILGSGGGRLTFEDGANIDVSGNASAQGGRVLFVAGRDGTNVRMDLAGTVSGASEVKGFAVRAYEYAGDFNISGAELQSWGDDARSFMDHLQWEPALKGVLPGVFSLAAGIEVRSLGNMILDAPWDLSSWRYGESAGLLTLRSAGDLIFREDLVDTSGSGPSSWMLQLSAGADLRSVDPLAVNRGGGDLVVADERAVFTRDASLRFAAGRDAVIGRANSERTQSIGAVPFTMGTSTGSIEGLVGRDVLVEGGSIQSETGGIRIEAGRDLILRSQQGVLGAVRTLGRLPSGFDRTPYSVEPFWEYAGGGNIWVRVNGKVDSLLNNNAWDYAYAYNYTDPDGVRRKGVSWGASFLGRNATQGLATMAGGDLVVEAGGDFLCQAGTFGKGDLHIQARGDVDGRFLVRKGTGSFVAMGNFGSRIPHTAMEAFESRIDVIAQGSVALGTVVNPTLARDGFTNQWNLTYSQDSRIGLFAKTGDVSLSGVNTYLFQGGGLRSRVLPPNVEIVAGGDIRLSNEYFMIPPAPRGSVRLVAGRDIDGQYFEGVGANAREKRSGLYLSDMDPAEVYGQQGSSLDANDLKDVYRHAPYPVHQGDEVPVEVRAGRDIRNLELSLTKQARITAGRDIRDISYFGQNVSSQDTTAIQAGRDIRFSSLPDVVFKTGIEHAGPGFLLVQAKNTIDLGTSKGISSVGNQYNPALGPAGSSVAVIAGYDLGTGKEDLQGFFDALKEAGTEYSTLLAAGDAQEAERRVEQARADIIKPFLGAPTANGGDLNMINSQINTSAGNDDIYLVIRGDLNVGRSTFFADETERKSTGIYTASGGGIHVFAGGDVNVNESRIMTFRGGDILVWSDEGNINAGRGSKTAINTEPPKPVLIEGVYVIQFNPPAVGSGIRTLTYDPDGIEGPQEAPVAGDVHLFAPQGEIDAGEAGIAGTNVVLGATTIANAQNIQFSQGSVGVPVASQGSGALGALAGSGALAETSRLAQESSPLGSAQDRLDSDKEKLAESFKPKWLDVKVIDFGEKEVEETQEPDAGKEKEHDKDRKS